MRSALIMMLFLCFCVHSYSQALLQSALQASGVQQGTTDGLHSISDKSLHFLQKQYGKLTATIDKQSQKILKRMQRKEEKLKSRLCQKDSTQASELFAGSEQKYKALQSELSLPADSLEKFPLREYLPGIDSMGTAMRFLQQKGINLPTDKMEEVNKTSSELQTLQDKLQKADDIEAFVKQREKELKEQLQNSPLVSQLKSINKEAFYYQERLREYKDLLNDQEKIQQKVLSAVRESRLFQSFMQRNSYLAKLFPTPQSYGTPAALASLQTRDAVQAGLQQRFGTSSFSASLSGAAGGSSGNSNYLQQQMRSAQTQLSALKDKMSKLGMSGGSSDMTMPDFKPNSQHTKSFLKRLEYGMNVQSEKSHSIIPATSDVALIAGYKINDESTIGIGASYRMGWGSGGIKHIRISSEGVGLRSYLDIKAKGSIWISGGYEMNYMQSFSKYQQLREVSDWQRSGLIGLTKKYKVGKKENNIQLLWDFLSYRQLPRAPALKFRVGFKL